MRHLMVWTGMAILALSAWGQAVSESALLGTVVDSSGAAVPDVRVIATNLDTGLVKETVSDSVGNFALLTLPNGSYSIVAKANGFKTWELKSIKLDVGDRSRISPVLNVGDLAEVVSVEATAELVQTEKGSVQTVVEMKQIRELPLDTRNPLKLVSLVPGMVWNGTQEGGERATYVQGQGLRDNKTAFQLDGLNSNAPMDEGGTAIPNVDTIAEFNVQTLNFSAESGRDPMQVLVATKSGTNEFHGTLWEFLQNDALNARNTFAVNRNRVRRNQFGGAGGGPVIRNRTFFFASLQSTLIRNESVYNSYAVTPAMKRGDFSALSKTIVNPYDNGNPFPGKIIPDSMISPASKAFLNYILEPNWPDGFFRQNASSSNDTWEGTMRVDHQFTNAQRIYGRYVNVHQPQTVLGYKPTPDITGNAEVIQHNLGVNYTWTKSASTLVTLAAGMMKTRNQYSNPALGKKNEVEAAGIQGIPTKGREQWVGPPDLGFANGYTGVGFPGGWGVPGALWGNAYNAKGGITEVRGAHTLSAGVEYGNWQTFGAHGSACPRGSFFFGNQYTRDGFADYLLGLASYGCRNDPLTQFGNDRAPYTGYYVQDTWRVHRNLTLDFGMRYERWLAHHSYNEISSAWDPTHNVVAVAVNSAGNANLSAFTITPFLAAATKGLWAPANTLGLPAGLYAPNGNWAPRLSAVYRPSMAKDLVVRAGYGVYYNSYTGNRGASTINIPHWGLEAKTMSLTTLQRWETFWPADPQSFTSFAIYSPLVNIRPARTHEWNLSVQTMLPLRSALTLSYVGTKVGNEVGAQQYNEAIPGPHSDLQADRPFPRLAGIQVYRNMGSNWYHAAQAKLERRFAKSVGFTLSYSFSRSMADNLPDCESCSLVPYAPAWYTRGRTSFDRRQIEYATLVWEMPLGRGRHYLTGLNRGADVLLGGWAVALTQQGQSGSPLSIGSGTANLGNGWGTRANVVGSPSAANPSPQQWFNTAAFAAPALYTFGNAGVGLLEGPGFFQVNTSLSKGFHLTESKYFQFRWEAFNLTNRVNYYNPSTSLTDGNFGRITGAGSARYMQLGLKFIF